MKIKNITAIILSGGKSSRIGTDKALLKLGNRKVIEVIFSVLDKIFQNIIIITNKIDEFRFLNTDLYTDIFPGFGPLSGIHSGLHHSETERNFVISVDMPLITYDLISYIGNYKSMKDIIIPTSPKKYYVLCALYKKSCLDVAENLLKKASTEKSIKSGKSSVKLFDLINIMKTEYLDISRKNFYTNDIMLNMNTLEDYEYVKSVFTSQKK